MTPVSYPKSREPKVATPARKAMERFGPEAGVSRVRSSSSFLLSAGGVEESVMVSIVHPLFIARAHIR